MSHNHQAKFQNSGTHASAHVLNVVKEVFKWVEGVLSSSGWTRNWADLVDGAGGDEVDHALGHVARHAGTELLLLQHVAQRHDVPVLQQPHRVS